MESKGFRQENRKRFLICLSVAMLCALLSAACSVLFGAVNLSVNEFFSGVLGQNKTAEIILYGIRIPRMFGACLSGIGLSVSGVLLQSVTNNDLAGPNIIGVNSGAGLGVILALLVCPENLFAMPFFAFVGALLVSILIVLISGTINGRKETVILVGIAVTAIINAVISFVSLLDSDILSSYNFFSVGGLSGTSLNELLIPCVLIAAVFVVSLCLASYITALSLGDNIAASLSVSVKKLRFICLILASASAGAAVSFAGLLGFVGLVVPHIVRRLVGGDAKKNYYNIGARFCRACMYRRPSRKGFALANRNSRWNSNGACGCTVLLICNCKEGQPCLNLKEFPLKEEKERF